MNTVSGKQLARLLERHGWRLLRVHGSHHIFGKSGSVVRLSVPVHANKNLKAGLLKHLLQLADLSEKDMSEI